MYNNVEIYAGDRAAEIIRSKGLKEDDIKVMVGASGGPKFLVLSGLDRAIFSAWFKKRKDPLFYIGSSIGSWRGAAFAAKNPIASLKKLTESYMKQFYTSKPSRKNITDESVRILNDYLKDDEIDYILNRSKIKLSAISAYCPGLSGYESNIALAVSFIPAVLANVFSRNLLLKIFTRTLFYEEKTPPPFIHNFMNTKRIVLTKDNLKEALLSSGSIPFAMEGVTNIPGATGTYRDGGLTDYHINIDFGINDGIVLFPHFSRKVIPGWLDKHLPWRMPDKNLFSNTILIAPSDDFIKKLPYGKIPDRTDFKTFYGRDNERLEYWHEVINRSSVVGDEFMEAVDSGKIKNIIKSF